MRKTIIEAFVLNWHIKALFSLTNEFSFMAPNTFKKAQSYIFLWSIIPTELSDNMIHVKSYCKNQASWEWFSCFTQIMLVSVTYLQTHMWH